jgi:hypothetical protein
VSDTATQGPTTEVPITELERRILFHMRAMEAESNAWATAVINLQRARAASRAAFEAKVAAARAAEEAERVEGEAERELNEARANIERTMVAEAAKLIAEGT